MTVRFVELAPGTLDHERLWSAVGITALVAGAAWLRFLGLPPLDCPFHALTGLPCPTCGATRAFAALLAGHAAVSLRLHPAVLPGTVLGFVYLAYALCTLALGLPRLRLGLSPAETRVARWTTVGAMAACWAVVIVRGTP